MDITNYVLIEIGQPMHSFDKRELTGGEIVVRNAKDGETIVTLDGKENKLNESMLVICDSDSPVAVAGIMGGANSSIQDDTNEVVFEAANLQEITYVALLARSICVRTVRQDLKRASISHRKSTA